jgi:hypothetical protein
MLLTASCQLFILTNIICYSLRQDQIHSCGGVWAIQKVKPSWAITYLGYYNYSFLLLFLFLIIIKNTN